MIYSTKIINFIQNELENNTSLFVETPFHDSNPGLRKGKLLFDLTHEETKELELVKNELIYFANNYCRVQTYTGIDQVKLRDYQEAYLKFKEDHKFIVALASRQVGKTMTQSIYCLYNILRGKNILLIANKRDSCVEILDKIKLIYKNLPFYMKPGINIWNQASIKFDNGASINIGFSSRSLPIRDYDLIYIDEAAHIPTNLWRDIYGSVLTLIEKNDGQLIIQSSPNGCNHFYDIYDKSTKGLNKYNHFKIHWTEVPGRDDEWKEKEIVNLGSEEIFDQEYDLKFINLSNENREANQTIKTLTGRIDILEKLVAALLNDKNNNETT